MVKKKVIRNDLKVIALIGEPNTGKSLTMRNVIIELLNSGAQLLVPKKYSKWTNDDIIKDMQQKTFTKRGAVSDITVFFEINGKRILVTTYGDVWGGLEGKFKKEADIYVCAAHNDFIKDNKGNNLKKVTKNGWLITIGRNFYNSTCPSNLNVSTIQRTLQKGQALFIAQEIHSRV